MTKSEFARELILGEVKKEQGGFVTMRIVDRLLLLYAPLFDREFLSGVAETINHELTQGRGRGLAFGT